MYNHRQQYVEMINSRRWQQTRALVLQRDGGICADCAAEGRATVAREVHHIRPVEWEHTRAAMERAMFDPSNLVALCHACHRRRHAELGSARTADRKAREQAHLERRIAALMAGEPTTPGGIFQERGEGV